MGDTDHPPLQPRCLHPTGSLVRSERRILVVVGRPRRMRDLRRGVEEITGQEQGVVPVLELHHTVSRRVTWCVPEAHAPEHLVVRCFEIEHPELPEGRHRESAGEVVWCAVLAEERPVVWVRVVASVRESRAPVASARAAGVVGVQMRQDDVLDVVRRDARNPELFIDRTPDVVRGTAEVPDPGIDQHDPVQRAKQERVNVPRPAPSVVCRERPREAGPLLVPIDPPAGHLVLERQRCPPIAEGHDLERSQRERSVRHPRRVRVVPPSGIRP